LHISLPPGKKIIHATNDGRDLQKDYRADYPILGDAKLVLRQMIDSVEGLVGTTGRISDDSVRKNIKRIRENWLAEWMPKLTSDEVPITPYRVIWEFMKIVDPPSAIVTHDSGSPRDQLVPFYSATQPRGYIGWGKSHALGTGLGLIMGAKMAAPDKFCVNFMGDAAFGMTGLDFETSVRSKIPITTIVMNNSTMASEKEFMPISHERFRTRDMRGNYAEMGRSMGGTSERVESPAEISGAITMAMKINAAGQSVLLEFITGEETALSHVIPF
jgi:acetolactate synthase-1/2/3 large subunit